MQAKFIFAFGILVVCAVALPDSCTKALAEVAHLNLDQRRAINDARPTHDVRILEATVDGVPRTIVIMGEIHTQDQYSADIGKAVVNAFPNRAVESYPGGPLWKAFLRTAYFIHGLTAGKGAGSSITYSQQHAALAAKAKRLVSWYRLKELTPEKLDKFTYNHKGTIFSGRDLIRLSEVADQVSHWRIEKDFEPNLRESLAAWGIPALMLAPKASPLIGLGSLYSISHGSAEMAMGWLAAAAFAYVGSGLAETTYLPGLGSVLRPRRDEHMAKNLQKHFEKSPENKVILLIAGKNHGNGISRELGKLGFKNVLIKDNWPRLPGDY